MSKACVLAVIAAVLHLAGAAVLAQGGKINIQFPDGTMPVGKKKLSDYFKKTTAWLFVDAKPASVEALREAARLHKAYGKNEGNGGFIIVNVAPADEQQALRPLLQGVPWEVILDPGAAQTNNAFGIPLDQLPIISMMNGQAVITWSGPAKDYEPQLVKALGVDAAPPPVEAENADGALASIAEGMKAVEDRGEFTPLIERLAGLDVKHLDDDRVMRAAADAVIRMKMEKQNTGGIERALRDHPRARGTIETIARRTATLLGSPVGGRGARAEPEAPAVDAAGARAKLAERKLADAEKLQLEGKDVEAYEQFKQIADRFTDTEAGKLATGHVGEYEKDPQFLRKYQQASAETKAAGILKMARSYLAAGRKDLAAPLLTQLERDYPDTAAAAEARTLDSGG